MQTRHSLRSVVKIYGVSKLSIVTTILGCIITMIFLGIMWSVVGALPGYFIGDYLSQSLHNGVLQRRLHWELAKIRNKVLLPPSSTKFFI